MELNSLCQQNLKNTYEEHAHFIALLHNLLGNVNGVLKPNCHFMKSMVQNVHVMCNFNRCIKITFNI